MYYYVLLLLEEALWTALASGGSSNPKGGANRKTIEGKGKVSGRRGLERPPIEETRFKVYPEENVD
jgi:hypothetical protein